MKKILGFLLGFTLLTGCAESLALLGPTSTAVTGGNIAQSALSSAVNYGVKKQTGKSPMEHALSYAEEMNPQKNKEPCLSFAESFKMFLDLLSSFVDHFSQLWTLLPEHIANRFEVVVVFGQHLIDFDFLIRQPFNRSLFHGRPAQKFT